MPIHVQVYLYMYTCDTSYTPDIVVYYILRHISYIHTIYEYIP